MTVCLRHHSLIHDGFISLHVDERGRVFAKNKAGQIVGREIPSREVLADAPRETAFTEIELEEKPTWVFPSSEVVVAPHPPLEKVAHSFGSPSLAHASLSDLPAVLTAPRWRALEGRLEWSGSRKVFLLRECNGDLEDPRPQGREAPERDGTGSPSRAFFPSNRPSFPSNRPSMLEEIVGQKRVVENLALAVKAARERSGPLGHVLLTGQPGLGKTTLAGALAREMGGRLHAAMGALISEPAQIIGLLARLERNDVLFIDEIHRLPAHVTECLHAAMEDRVVQVLVAERGRVRTLRVELEPFTLAGATMEPGSLPEAFRARFLLQERLGPYAEDDLARIAGRAAPPLGLPASAGACAALARRARGTPREALRLLERSRDVAQAEGSASIEALHVEDAAKRLEIDADGLQADERRILAALILRGRPMGLETLAATLGMDRTTLRNVHEPYLLARGYLIRTTRGREATRKARLRMAKEESLETAA